MVVRQRGSRGSGARLPRGGCLRPSAWSAAFPEWIVAGRGGDERSASCRPAGCVRHDDHPRRGLHDGGIHPGDRWGPRRCRLACEPRTGRACSGARRATRARAGHMHAGYLPSNGDDGLRTIMVGRLRQIADRFAARGVALGLETGTETAEGLLSVGDELAHPDVCVSFDPANMILHDTRDPVGRSTRSPLTFGRSTSRTRYLRPCPEHGERKSLSAMARSTGHPSSRSSTNGASRATSSSSANRAPPPL